MLSNRQFFQRFLAQTSDQPLMIEVERALGVELYCAGGQVLLDLISGISVAHAGHCHPKVVEAVTNQAAKYMHVMVYGELIQSPQVAFASALASKLPGQLQVCYLVNSGSEAIEGAMKLAKRYTNRSEMVAFHNAYHGSTQGALSLNGSEIFRNAFRPLLPGVRHIPFNDTRGFDQINPRTACVIVEPIQGEAGAVVPAKGFLEQLARRCREVGALLVMDEVQTGFRRTGPFMAFQEEGVVPDILVLAKSMGGGMPLGAFISSPEIMKSLSHDPVLGHITTFGGHPVSCAAALAALRIVEEIDASEVVRKGELFRSLLRHECIVSVSGRGLMLAVEFPSAEFCRSVISRGIELGVMTDWFLFAPERMRIAPPLVIEDHQIFMACEIILKAVREVLERRAGDPRMAHHP